MHPAKPTWPRFSKADSPLEALVKLSRYYGGDPDFVLAGGGNTSVKVGDKLFVKASGVALAAIGPDGFVAMDRAKLSAVLGADLPADRDAREAALKERLLAARAEADTNRRPSIESLLHNLLPDRFIVHTHATCANMVACCRQGRALAAELFGDEVLWIPCVDPGFPLARTIAAEAAAHQKRTGRPSPQALLMENHGLIVSGQTVQDIRDRTDRIIGAIRKRLEQAGDRPPFGAVVRAEPAHARAAVNRVAPALRALLADGERLKVARFDDSPPAVSLAAGSQGESVTSAGPLSPDQIAFSASYPMWFDPKADEPAGQTVERLREALRQHEAQRHFPPKVVLLRGVGMLAVGESVTTAENARLLYANAIEVMAGAQRLGGIRPLPEDLRVFVENWEVERFRQRVAAGGQARGRAAGKVAIVTGAAQGFGLEIARDLAAEGACVALADVKVEGAATAAQELCDRFGPGRAGALPMDVTDAQSAADAIHQVVRTYGGVDLLVSNAGILRAGSVLTQPVEEFDSVTAVNYKGYFVCVQQAAPVMAVQHLANRDCWSDVIQINSKSGLEGSNRNSAYAGSKFGGIGLTQSFALELVADGIKVNSICPGNFFDGPLWSDPRTGLFVQYLRTGKVPGARTIEDVRKAYEAKVPMGRGCTAADVMKAVYYLIEQKYETGQAVPVTGGQVMLR